LRSTTSNTQCISNSAREQTLSPRDSSQHLRSSRWQAPACWTSGPLRSRRGRVTPARRERRAHESGSSSDEDHCAAPRYRLTNAYLPGYPLINS
jgi:hypothetical protein